MEKKLQEIAGHHKVSVDLLRELLRDLQASRGRQVHFNHPDFGGVGQWRPGVVTISDIFNHKLRAKVDAVCTELAELVDTGVVERSMDTAPVTKYGNPFVKGVQNQFEYAYYPAAKRLVVKSARGNAVYDTSGYQITGVTQQPQQAEATQSLMFNTAQGPITLDSLREVQE